MRILFVFLILTGSLNSRKIYWDLAPLLENAGNEKIRIIVHMKGEADLSHIPEWDKRGRVERLMEFATESQRDILEYLRSIDTSKVSDIRPFWIFNGIFLNATKDIIWELARRPDVDVIEKSDTLWIFKYDTTGEIIENFNWNIRKIQADSVWINLGISGDGVILGNLDTGVDVDHPALSSKYLGYWHDAVNHLPDPYDDNGHGTHTMGTIVGGDGPGSLFPDSNDVGIAYGAKFVAAKGFSSGGYGLDEWILECYEWFAYLISQGVEVRIVSNSWGSNLQTNLTFWEATLNWRNLGIIPVFAIGNAGPGFGTAGTPGNFPIVIGVGATGSDDNVANFSSRGPAPNQNPWNDPQYWSRPDWNFIKPDIAAPGVTIRSTVPGGGFEASGWSGTSMATPHVAATIALMLEKNPSLEYYQIYDILLNSADQPVQGNPYPNINYGWGRLNAYRAVMETPTYSIPYLRYISYLIDDSGGNNNGLPDPGEEVTLYITIRNLGATAIDVEGYMETSDTSITLLDPVSIYGTINTGDTTSGDGFIFTSNPNRRPGQPVYFDIEISGTDTNGTPFSFNFPLSFDIGTPVYHTWFIDDMEQGMINWVSGGTSEWGITGNTYHSPVLSLTDSPDGNYGNNEHSYLILSWPFDLSNAYHARLILWHRYDFEPSYDFGYIEISTDSTDNSNWMTVATYTGLMNTWTPDTVDISNLAGEEHVYIRFLLESDESYSRDGWYIDDVEIQLDYPPENIHLYVEDFQIEDESGNGNGYLDPGEYCNLYLTLRNLGIDTAFDVTLQIETESNLVVIEDNLSYYGTIAPLNSSTGDEFIIHALPDAPVGVEIPFTLYLSAYNFSDTISFELMISDSIFLPTGACEYGYYAYEDIDYSSESPLFEWFEIAPPGPGTIIAEITDEDADTVTLPLPFTFKYFGIEYDSIGICSNGFVEMGKSTYRFGSNAPIPYPGGPKNLIAPFWDDLDPGQNGDIYQYYDEENHRWILEFYQVAHHDEPSMGYETFQVILYDPLYHPTETGDGEIVFQYLEVGDYSSCTVGIENQDENDGIQMIYNGGTPSTATTIGEGRAIKFTTDPPLVLSEDHTGLILRNYTLGINPSIIRNSTTIKLYIPKESMIHLKVYDVQGRRISEILRGRVTVGEHVIPWNTDKLRNGIYFIRLESNGRSLTKKVVVIR
jgi:subtilisin family serine protease